MRLRHEPGGSPPAEDLQEGLDTGGAGVGTGIRRPRRRADEEEGNADRRRSPWTSSEGFWELVANWRWDITPEESRR
jgi:hypothetical protein